MNSEHFGLVKHCELWKARKVEVRVGESIYPFRTPKFSCQMGYHLRDFSNLGRNKFSNFINFSLSFSEGLGDGDYFITGQTELEASQIIDMTKDYDEKAYSLHVKSKESIVRYINHDDAFDGKATLVIQSTDLSSNEVTSLTAVINRSKHSKKLLKGIDHVIYVKSLDGVTLTDVTCR